MRKIVVGTRGSKLALTQTEIAINALKSSLKNVQFDIKVIRTTGDTYWDRPLEEIKGKGFFVKEIEEALISKEIDLAVHSMKDVPLELKDGLKIGAILKREDPRDCFVSFEFDSIFDLPRGARVGTSSVRRKVQLEGLKEGIEVVPLRGNVETRLRKIKTEGLFGCVLAYCGIKRLGLENFVKEIIPKEILVPCAGQGAIAIEVREDWEYIELLDSVRDEITETEIELEREILRLLGGGCQLPFGVNVEKDGENFLVYAFLSSGKEQKKVNLAFPLSEKSSIPQKVVQILSPQKGAHVL